MGGSLLLVLRRRALGYPSTQSAFLLSRLRLLVVGVNKKINEQRAGRPPGSQVVIFSAAIDRSFDLSMHLQQKVPKSK